MIIVRHQTILSADYNINRAMPRSLFEFRGGKQVAALYKENMQPLRLEQTRTRNLPQYPGRVPNPDIQIVSNEQGEATAVIVPIELWREIASERETAYLLKSNAMKERLLTSLQRHEGISLDDAVPKLPLVLPTATPDR